MAAHRIFRFATESVYNVRDTSPTGTFYIPMDDDNYKPATLRPPWAIMDGSGLNVPRLRGSEIYQYQGALSTRIYWDHNVAQYLIPWLTRVNANQTAPWTTNQAPLDYASATIDFAYGYGDDSLKRTGCTGCKPGESVTFSSSNDPSKPFLMAQIPIIGTTPNPNNYTSPTGLTITTFPEPALTALPYLPLTFQQTTFTTFGNVCPYFDRFSLTIASKVKAYYDNGRFPNRIHCRGRTVTLTVHPRLDLNFDARVRYEAMQALGALSITFTNPVIGGGHTTADTLTFDFRSQTFLDSVAEDLAMDSDPYAQWTATAHLDTGVGDDFAITYTPGA